MSGCTGGSQARSRSWASPSATSPRAAEQLARRTGVTYPLAVDPAGRAFDAFGGLGMPTTVLVRADGTVADILAGQLSDAQTDRPWDQFSRAVAGPLTRSRLSRPPGSDRGEPCG